MMFFDKTPVGRIINRFSTDVATVDDSLPFILNILLAQTFGLLGTKLSGLFSEYSGGRRISFIKKSFNLYYLYFF
jgi:hypothetical protein